MIFRTFRQRLLFWFMVFISGSLLVILLTFFYLQRREQILRTSQEIDAAQVALLKSVLLQQEFFSYETINAQFFETGQSIYLDRYGHAYDSTIVFLTKAQVSANRSNFNLENQLTQQQSALMELDTLFRTLIQRVKQRGFKDYNLEEKCGLKPIGLKITPLFRQL